MKKGQFVTVYTGMNHANDMVNFVTFCNQCGKAVVDTKRNIKPPNIGEYRYCPFCGADIRK